MEKLCFLHNMENSCDLPEVSMYLSMLNVHIEGSSRPLMLFLRETHI